LGAPGASGAAPSAVSVRAAAAVTAAGARHPGRAGPGGGGGGSFNAGNNQRNTPAAQAGNGYVVIKRTFLSAGLIRHFTVPSTGTYVIEAGGAHGGVLGADGRGAKLRGSFLLNQGEVLQIVVGKMGTPGSSPDQPGGGGGGSFVWQGATPFPLPAEPLLAAAGGGGGFGSGGAITLDGDDGGSQGGVNGQGGASDTADFSGGGGAGWLSNGASGSTPTNAGGGAQWAGGGSQAGLGGGGGGSFNAGTNQTNTPAFERNHGFVYITLFQSP
jgi:hypothetical protein